MFATWRSLGRTWACVAVALAVTWGTPALGQGRPTALGYLELDTKSEFSHIRIYRKNSFRTMVFVRDSGEEVLETQVNLERPFDLHFPYVPYLFNSYLLQPKPEKILIVGLGGGSMVHFLRRYDPHVQVEAIEIDTEVVRLAEKYFGVKGGDKVTIRTGDGIDYLEKTDAKYDVIYMDAFLKPAAGTDATGAPLRSRTLRFYHEIQNKLTSTGLVAFNLNPHANLQQDLATIREGFAQTYVFQIPKNQGMVVLASAAPERVPLAMLNKRARELDRRFGANFSFRALLPNLQRENAR